MSATDKEIFDKLASLLEKFNTKKIVLTPSTEISSDLNIDSVAVMDFIMEVEDAYDIDIPLNVLADTHSMDQLVKVVQKEMG